MISNILLGHISQGKGSFMSHHQMPTGYTSFLYPFASPSNFNQNKLIYQFFFIFTLTSLKTYLEKNRRKKKQFSFAKKKKIENLSVIADVFILNLKS